MARYKEREGWVFPRRRGFRMACCDCGLVHEIDFDVVKRGKNWTKPIFRVTRRNERSTALMRRQNDFRCKPAKDGR